MVNQMPAGFVMTKKTSRDKLYKKLKILPSESNFIALANIKKEVKKLIRQDKRNQDS